MRRPSLFAVAAALQLWTLAGPPPAAAVKNIIIDWERGEVTETVEPVDEEAQEEQTGRFVDGEDEKERTERLRKAVALQQQLIRRQRALIEELREENRRLNRTLLGYDRLLRQCR